MGRLRQAEKDGRGRGARKVELLLVARKENELSDAGGGGLHDTSGGVQGRIGRVQCLLQRCARPPGQSIDDLEGERRRLLGLVLEEGRLGPRGQDRLGHASQQVATEVLKECSEC